MSHRLKTVAVVFACALFGMALIGGTAEAKKKKKGKSSTITLTGKTGAIPDSTQPLDTDGDGDPNYTGNGGEFKNGIFASTITVSEKKETKVKDINVQVGLTHNDLSDLSIFLVGNGQYISLSSGSDNYPFGTVLTPPYFSLGVFGPTTFDDQAPLFISDTNSCPAATEDLAGGDCLPPRADGGGLEAFAPYVGSFKPELGTLGSLGNKLKGSYTLFVFDNDAAGDSTTDVADTGAVNTYKIIAEGKGGGKKKK